MKKDLINTDQPSYGLCYRCEHRAVWNETGKHRPRMECGSPTHSSHSCYMYQPVKPVMLGPRDTNDKRPRFAGWAISSRETSKGVPVDLEEHLVATNEQDRLKYWAPGKVLRKKAMAYAKWLALKQAPKVKVPLTMKDLRKGMEIRSIGNRYKCSKIASVATNYISLASNKDHRYSYETIMDSEYKAGTGRWKPCYRLKSQRVGKFKEAI